VKTSQLGIKNLDRLWIGTWSKVKKGGGLRYGNLTRSKQEHQTLFWSSDEQKEEYEHRGKLWSVLKTAIKEKEKGKSVWGGGQLFVGGEEDSLKTRDHCR